MVGIGRPANRTQPQHGEAGVGAVFRSLGLREPLGQGGEITAELWAPHCSSLPQAGRKACRDYKHPDCVCGYVHMCAYMCEHTRVYVCACMPVALMCVASMHGYADVASRYLKRQE